MNKLRIFAAAISFSLFACGEASVPDYFHSDGLTSASPSKVSIGSPSTKLIRTGKVTYKITYTNAATVNLTSSKVTVKTTGNVSYTKSVSQGTSKTPIVTITIKSGTGKIDSISIAKATSKSKSGRSDVGATNSTDVTIDNTAPTLAFNEPLTAIGPGNQSAYSISGTCSEAGKIVSLTAPVTASTPCASGAFSFSSLDLSALADGAVTFTASLSDSAGNSVSANADGNKDLVAPTVIIGAPNVAAINTGDVDYAVTYSGASIINLLADDHVAVNVTGTVTYTKSVLNGTTANPTIRIHITGGDGTVDSVSIESGSSHDDTGNLDEGASQGADVDVDNAAPTISLTAPGNITNSNKSSFSIAGTCSENGATVTITAPSAINGTTTTCASSAFSFTGLDVSSIPDGSVNFTVRITDALDNSNTDTKSATKDATPPSISSLSLSNPATSPGNDTTPEIQINGTFPIGDSIQLFSDATCTTSISSSVAATIANSVVITSDVISTNTTYTYFAKGTDAAGNTACSGAGISVSYTLDTVLPTLTFTTGANVNNANKSNYTIGGSCNENGRTVYVTAPAEMNALSTTCTAGAWSISSINMTGISDGPITMTVSLTDAAGNTRTTNRSISKDIVVPTVAITSLPAIDVSNQYSYSFSGTCSANGDNVTLLSPISGFTTSCSGGTFTISGVNVSGFADGTVNFYVQAYDAVNNTATHILGTTKSIGDTTPPSDPTCDSLEGNATPTKTDTVNWTGSSDDSGIHHYEMRVYRPKTGKDIIGWTDIGAEVNPYQFTGLTETKLLFNDEENDEHPVVYQIFIRAMDNYNNYSNEVQCPDWHLKPAYGNFRGETTKNPEDDRMFNAADPFALLFTTDKFNAAYFDHETVKNPQNIRIKEPGRYMLSLHQPMYRKNGNDDDKIAAAKTMVKVNDVETDHGFAANSLTWGLQNGNEENPLYTSNDMTILLDLNTDDIITVESQNNADETHKLVSVENQPFSVYLEFVPDEQAKLALTATNTDLSDDLNAGDGKVNWSSNIDEGSEITFNSEESQTLIQFENDGDYFISINMPLERNEGDGLQKIEAQILLNGEEIKNDNAMIAANDLITNQSGHTISSANYATLIQGVKKGDSIQVVLKPLGDSGVVRVPHHKPISMFIYKAAYTEKNNLMLTGQGHDWFDGGNIDWINEYITDADTFSYKNSTIDIKKDGDYVVSLNVDLQADTNYAKPIFYLTKNGDALPGATCLNANMSTSPEAARTANCVIEVLLEDLKAEDIIRLDSAIDVRDAKSNAYSSPKIHLRKVSESPEK